MTRNKEIGARREAKAAWSVVVVYEDDAARERAVGFCDQLVGRFWAKCDFDVSWWPFAVLEEPASAQNASLKAMGADLILFSTTPEGDFSQAVKAWTATWLHQRGEREGMLVGLMNPKTGSASRESQKDCYLRNAAHQSAMDYLTQLPPDIAFSIPEFPEAYTQRAEQVTSLLDSILHQHFPPPTLPV